MGFIVRTVPFFGSTFFDVRSDEQAHRSESGLKQAVQNN